MSALMNSISSVLVILLMTAAGYVFGAKKWMLTQHKFFFDKYLINFAIPCLCIDGFIHNLTPELLRGSWIIIALSFSGICICLGLSAIIAFFLRLPKKRASVFIAMGGFSNALFVGYPMCRELFGVESLPYVMLFFVSCTILVYGGCNAIFAWFSESDNKFSKKQVLRIFVNPPLISAVIGIIIVVSGLVLPRPLSAFLGYIGGTVSPLALFYCGFIIFESGIKNIRFDRGMAVMPVIRFVIAPLVGALLCRVFNVSPPASSILTVVMAMPVITILVVMAKEWEADAHYAAVGIVLSTIACFVVIPVLMLFF